MTKMDMVWVAVANLLHPSTDSNSIVTKVQIDSEVGRLFGETITPVMIEKHLVNSEDRQADRADPSRGGSRNRYLVRENGGYRLYKTPDQVSDAWDKTGPTHPNPENVPPEYGNLLTWYETDYANS